MRRIAAGIAVLLLLLLVPALFWLPLFDGLAPTRIDRGEGGDRPGGGAPRRVALVSIDGLAPRVRAEAATPTLDRLAREGRSAKSRTVRASYTLPSHTTMLSGVAPSVHDVFWNRYQPWSEIDVPTVFDACARAALRCALFAGKKKFAHFAEGERGVDRYAFAGDAASVLAEAVAYARERDPDLLVVHLAEVDLAGHDAGWGSEAQRDALRRVDALLGDFVAGLADLPRPLAVIVTADHGGEGTRHGRDTPEDRAIPWIAWGDGVGSGPLPPVPVARTAATVLALLGLSAPAAWAPPVPLAAAAPESFEDSGP